MPPKDAVMLLVFAAFVSGCATSPSTSGPPGNRQTLEKTVTELRSELAAVKAERDEMKQLLDQRRTVKTLGDNTTVSAEKPFTFEVTKVDFGFLTCGISLQGKKGDDAIAAYVGLYDQFDTPIKAAGHFRFDLFDLARSKDYVVQSWSFEPEGAARYWQRFPACYQFKLALAAEVRVKKVVLKVTFRQAGKKELAATRELTIERP